MWEYVDLHEGKSTISTKWIFKLKKDGNRKLLKRKARMVEREVTSKKKWINLQLMP